MSDEVPLNDRRVRYTVTNPAGQSEFIIDFPLTDVDFIAVYTDGDIESADDYTVDLTALTVTYDTAVPQGSIVTLEGFRDIKRVNAYPLRGDLRSPLLNADMNNIVYALQEMRRDIDQASRKNKADADNVSAVLPAITGNAGKAILVGASGLVLSDEDFSALSTSITDAIAAAAAAASSETNAAVSAAAAANLLDQFDDRYLGAKSSDPAVDNDGDPLIDGATYFNTASNVMRVYDLGGTSWADFNITGGGLDNIVEDITPQLGGNLDAQGTYKGVNFVDPTSAQDVATKAYVDANTGGGGGSWVPLQTIDLSNDSSFAFDDGVDGVVMDNTYPKYKVEISNAYGGSADIRFKVGGSVLSSSLYQNIFSQSYPTTPTEAYGGTTNQNKATNAILLQSTAIRRSEFTIIIGGVGISCLPYVRVEGTPRFSSEATIYHFSSGYNDTVTVSGISIEGSTGMYGTATLYGLAEA